MLQFWRRTTQKEKDCPTNQVDDVSITSNNLNFNILANLDDEGLCDLHDTDTSPQYSRLSKTLLEVLNDKSALGYFIQFLDAQNSLSYVRCYLDIESFRTAAELSENEHSADQVGATPTVITRDQLESTDFRLLSPLPSSKIDHDSLSVSTDCDSITDSTSLYDFSEKNCDNSDTSFKIQKLDINKRKCRLLTDDSLRIFKKYIAIEASDSIFCPDDLRNDIIESICSQNGVIHSNCYDKIQKYVFEVMNTYFQGYLRSHYNCKYQIDVLTSGNIILQDILYNESILFYFMEFLEQENCTPLLEFWLAVFNFKQQLKNQNISSEEVQNDAIVLYDKYFSLQATCPLGFSDKIRFIIEENICQDGGPNIDCFSQPVRIIESFLEKNYLKPFLSSQLYFKYLSELITSVQTNGFKSLNLQKSQKTLSDCSSSEISNTELNVPRKPPKTNMNIDTRQLYDPDSLWKRRKTRRLSFGRVTNLGKFETDVEPLKKSENRLTRAMKKLVNLEENKQKEELAWKVAEMIIKDVTNVTLADQTIKS